ncbi:MAG: aminotransferase class IV [Bacteroidota bacterium]|nr:aminotransferase class IV [Bacteroidota bacterium]
MEGYFNYNGKVLRNEKKAVISVDNRSFRYGDGCFETMKMTNGKILQSAYHQERLFTSLQALHFDKPNFFITEAFEQQIIELAKKNQHKKLARVRVTIFRGDGGLYDVENNQPNYLIQTWDLNSANNKLNENGLIVDVCKDVRKSCDKFSNIKSNNYLGYAMAAMWVKEQKMNDALVLNAYDRICDATIANVFLVKNGVIKTPALTEGCVSGTMRKYLLKCCREENLPVEETQIEAEELAEADELFLTNAVYGIRWVKECGATHYKQQLAEHLHEKFIAPLFL